MSIELIHGDCLDALKCISDNQVDLIVTDPPYGINYKSGAQTENRRSKGRPYKVRDVGYFTEIANDDKMPLEWIKDAFRILKSGGAVYIYCHWKYWGELSTKMMFEGFSIKNMIVLNKSNHGMGDIKGGYAPKHELCLFAAKDRHILRNPNGREKDVWEVKVKFSGAYHAHPNEKPLEWMNPAIMNSSDVNQMVLDPFMGSGSTGVAAVKLHRNFIGIELDEKYFKIAKQRIEEAEFFKE